MNFEHKQIGGSAPIEWAVLDLSIRFGISYAWKGQREEARFWFKMLRDCWACAESSTERPETQLVPIGELPDWCMDYASQLRISDDKYSDLMIEIENALQMLPENDMFALTLRQMGENITELWTCQKRGKASDYLSFVRENHASLFKLSDNLLDLLDSQRSFATWHRKHPVRSSRGKVPKSNS